MFHEGLCGLYKTFCDTTKKCENKNLSKFFSFRTRSGCERLAYPLNLLDFMYKVFSVQLVLTP